MNLTEPTGPLAEFRKSMIIRERRQGPSERWWISPLRGQAGMSALESMIVVVILGVLLGMSASRISGALARERADGWARTLTADVAAARQAALTRRTTVTVAVAGSGYTIDAGSGGTLRRAVLPADMVLATTCPASTCSFSRRGTPVAAGTITLTNTTTGRTFTIVIQAGTGRVSFSEP